MEQNFPFQLGPKCLLKPFFREPQAPHKPTCTSIFENSKYFAACQKGGGDENVLGVNWGVLVLKINLQKIELIY